MQLINKNYNIKIKKIRIILRNGKKEERGKN